MAEPKDVAAKVLASAKKIEPMIDAAKKHASEPLKLPLAPGVEQIISPMLKDLTPKLEAIRTALKKYEELVGKYASRASL